MGPVERVLELRAGQYGRHQPSAHCAGAGQDAAGLALACLRGPRPANAAILIGAALDFALIRHRLKEDRMDVASCCGSATV